MKPADQSVATGDNLDQVFGAFFRSEMPDPWPAFQPPLSGAGVPVADLDVLPATAPTLGLAPPVAAGLRTGSGNRSRFALAASVAVLVVGALLLPGRLTGPVDYSVPTPDPSPGSSKLGDLPVIPGGDVPTKPAGNIKSSLFLQQGDDGRTGIGISVKEEPSNK